MGIRRLGVLLKKEFVYGSKGFLFLVIGGPILMSVVVTLVFGDLTFVKPTAGIYAQPDSGIFDVLTQEDSIRVKAYGSEESLLAGVSSGEVEVGIALPGGFDDSMRRGETPTARMYFYGESYAKDRLVIGAAFLKYGRTAMGQKPSFSIESIVLGDADDLPWNERLLPFIVLMTILMCGIFLPGTSLISEKEKGTLQALNVSPATTGEVFYAKGILAFAVCLSMGVVILTLNSSFGAKPGLLVAILALGAVMSVTIGLMLGYALADVTALFAIWKSASIVLFAPGVIYMFPGIPQWIGKIFPTYYLIAPINEINLKGAQWADVSIDVFILIAIDVALVALLAVWIKRARRKRSFTYN